MPDTESIRKAARNYIREGWRVVPVPEGKKGSVIEGWPKLRVRKSQIAEHFTENGNIGILTGEPSGELEDVDLDCDEAVSLAPHFLPPTRRIHGRKSRDRSHYWYYSDAPIKSQKFCDIGGECLLELRSTGLQTLAPPSLHPDGERLSWADRGKPGRVSGMELVLAGGRLAAGCLIARHWPTKGKRNEVALALAGTVVQAGWTDDEAIHLIRHVAKCAGDEEWKKRGDAIQSTRKRLDEGRVTTGYTRLSELLGEKIVSLARDWLGISPQGAVDKRSSPGKYCVHQGQICSVRFYKDKVFYIPLCNFDARIAEEITLDDGVESSRAFVINGKLDAGTEFPSIRIPAAKFSSMSWPIEHWGIQPVVNAGFSNRDKVREAIQRLSAAPLRRRVFTHTGWREQDGKWIFLTSTGALGAENVEVDTGNGLQRYSLPSTPENPKLAMQASLKLLQIAPLEVTMPLWASMFRAPLARFLPPNFSLWLEGKTGSFKSTLAALFLSHFGKFDCKSLPGTWESTANQLESRAFTLKDLPFVVDDYAPKPLHAFREMEAKAARLLRAQGNLSGRGRLRSDLTERPDRPPRGIIISTGEQHPSGQSLIARILLIQLEKKGVDVSALTTAQSSMHLLPHGMAGYVQWLAKWAQNAGILLTQLFEQARFQATTGGHARVAEVIAHVWLGLYVGTWYAEEVGAISHQERNEMLGTGWQALLDLGKKQQFAVEIERPTRRFLQVLSTLLSQDRVAVLPKHTEGGRQQAGKQLVGWGDKGSVYLLPDAAYESVSRFLRDTGEPFSLRQERLARELFEEGLSQRDSEHFTVTAKVGGRVRRVIRLSRNKVEALLGEPFPYGVTVLTGPGRKESPEEMYGEMVANYEDLPPSRPVKPVTKKTLRLRHPRIPLRFPRCDGAPAGTAVA